ncbi:MAG TPA: hypothetical protein VHO48_05155 [Anaerolineaceae bacterium]|nr:hypothetical protein [Anaerolineaceae bacterium]
MPSDRTLWPSWAHFLHRWGIGKLTASLFDTPGLFAVLGAQFLYFGQPFINSALPDGHLQALANLLEDPAELKTFAAYLREDKPL